MKADCGVLTLHLSFLPSSAKEHPQWGLVPYYCSDNLKWCLGQPQGSEQQTLLTLSWDILIILYPLLDISSFSSSLSMTNMLHFHTVIKIWVLVQNIDIKLNWRDVGVSCLMSYVICTSYCPTAYAQVHAGWQKQSTFPTSVMASPPEVVRDLAYDKFP